MVQLCPVPAPTRFVTAVGGDVNPDGANGGYAFGCEVAHVTCAGTCFIRAVRDPFPVRGNDRRPLVRIGDDERNCLAVLKSKARRSARRVGWSSLKMRKRPSGDQSFDSLGFGDR